MSTKLCLLFALAVCAAVQVQGQWMSPYQAARTAAISRVHQARIQAIRQAQQQIYSSYVDRLKQWTSLYCPNSATQTPVIPQPPIQTPEPVQVRTQEECDKIQAAKLKDRVGRTVKGVSEEAARIFAILDTYENQEAVKSSKEHVNNILNLNAGSAVADALASNNIGAVLGVVGNARIVVSTAATTLGEEAALIKSTDTQMAAEMVRAKERIEWVMLDGKIEGDSITEEHKQCSDSVAL